MIIDVLVDPILKNTFRKFFSIYAGSKFWPGKLFERVQYHVLDLVRTYNFGPTYFLRNRPKLQFRTKTESGSQLQFGTCSEISKPFSLRNCIFGPESGLQITCQLAILNHFRIWFEIAILVHFEKKNGGPKLHFCTNPNM